MATFMKRPNDDTESFALSSHTSFKSDLPTPPEKRRFFESSNNNLTGATILLPSQQLEHHYSLLPQASPTISSKEQSLTTPPTSPLKTHPKQSKAYSTTNSVDSEEWRLLERPPSGASPEEYSKFIPVNMVEPVRMSQLMIWSAYGAMQKKKVTFGRGTANEQKADRIASDIQTRILKGLVKGEINTSIYAYKPSRFTLNSVKKNANPRNDINRQRIRDFKEALSSLETEDYEWREVTSKLFQQHAAMLDEASRSSLETETTITTTSTTTAAAATKEPIPIPITQHLLDGLDDNEKQFLDTYCREGTDSDTDLTIEPRIKSSDMVVEVTELRQRLSVVKEFQKSVEKLCRDTMAGIARNMQRGALAVPAEKASLAKAVAQEKALEDIGKETSKDILRMLSRYTANNINK
ncbi:hypothetical protein BDB00DRAFT_938372 [Zychaea mexicana]|uniref:uncharacterized protein n=1 Tax=Zychaea mexicana TaxID=64656 RepID=UPI0022FDCA36|nr:uncharacterized protein BDB00DRAFT_938372 [Zychaea mexicana]KAI9494376.1 hypothetical protein BDB00DRAFT_938372 [Zychaea mexicana]